MIVEELERRFFELKGKLNVGVVTEEQFKAEVAKLRFQGSDDRWWMIGAQSGKWYSFDGVRWIPGQPPHDAAPSTAVEPAPAETPPSPSAREETTTTAGASPAELPAVPPATPPIGLSAPTTTRPERLSGPAAAPPPQPEHIQRAPRRRVASRPAARPRLSLAAPLLIAGAAFFALLSVIVFWILLDNLVPGKPISGFLAGLMGGRTSPVPALAPQAVQSTAPKELTLLVTAGDQFVLQSQMDTAIAQYQSAAQVAPQSSIPLARLARAYAFKGQLQDAVVRSQQATQRGPNDAEAFAQYSRSMAWSGQTSDAIMLGEKAVQLDARNLNAHAFLAEAYLLARRPTDAQPHVQTALQLSPSSAEARRAQAWLLTTQGQKEAALAEWRQTIALEPEFYFRHFEYGEVLRIYFNTPGDAVAEYQKALSLYGAYLPTTSRLGLALLAANRPQEAIRQFQRTLTMDPNTATASTYLGIAFGQSNQCGQAIPYFEQALRTDPNNSTAQKGLSDCKSGKTPSLAPIAPQPVPLTPPSSVPSPQ